MFAGPQNTADEPFDTLGHRTTPARPQTRNKAF